MCDFGEIALEVGGWVGGWGWLPAGRMGALHVWQKHWRTESLTRPMSMFAGWVVGGGHGRLCRCPAWHCDGGASARSAPGAAPQTRLRPF